MKDQEFITPIDQYVIDFVRKLRDDKTLTQKDIATIIGVTREFIKDIENTNKRAKYNIRHINSLADYFDMSPREFLPEKPVKLFSRSSKQKILLKEKSIPKKSKIRNKITKNKPQKK